MVTAHFKHLDDNLRRDVTRFITRTTSDRDPHIIHACLIGFDWSQYEKLGADPNSIVRIFEERYVKYGSNIASMLQSRHDTFAYKHLTLKFLFLPFRSVDEFRRLFNEKL
jgi:hypothetical protein